MPDISLYLDAAVVGSSVTKVTGVTLDGVVAGGYAAWINSITGENPRIIPLEGNRVRLVLTDTAAVKMQRWLDSQLRSALTAKDKKPNVEYDLGPVIGPYLFKFAVPVAVAFFLMGWVSHWYFGR